MCGVRFKLKCEWKECNLGKICASISKTFNGKQKYVVLINTSDVLNGKILNNSLVENINLKGQFKKTFLKNDILYSEIRPANRRFAYVDIPETTNYIASTKLMVIRANEQYVRPKYLFFILSSENLINYLQSVAETRSGTFPQITFEGEVANIRIKIPNLNTQDKIVKILSSLDDKIEQNNAINHNLQQLIRSIFDKWFICSYKTTSKDIIQTTLGSFPSDFKMQRLGELPIQVTDYVANGSFASLKENVKLFQERNYAYFIRNTDLKSGSFEVFVDKHSYDFLIKSRLFGGEIIISNVGDVGSVFLCPVLDAPMTLGNNIIMLKPQDDFLRFYLFIWFKYSIGQGLIQGIKSGCAQPKFNKTDFKNLPIILPPKELLMRFHSLVLPMFESIEKNNSENRKLNCLRNTLLPKLMSGELDVSEVEI